MTETGRGFATRAVHGGRDLPEVPGRPVAVPISPASSFVAESMEELDAVFGDAREGYVYNRYGNPTTAALEQAVADLEGGEHAVAFASGMAAVHAAFVAAGLGPGTSVVAARVCYGATYTLLTQALAANGVQVTLVDVPNTAEVAAAIERERPRAVFLETVDNPLLAVADLPAVVKAARSVGALVLVDNTFLTPYLLRPLDLGADMVVHSATKFLGGHGDATAGIVISRPEHLQPLRSARKLFGGVLSPFEAWMVLRGLRTLHLRMERQCQNALLIARWLEGRPEVARVYYPGLASHPQHEVAARLFGQAGYGAMVAFDLAEGDRAKVFRFMDALRLCVPATTLGDVYTLLLYPAMSSHRALPPEVRRAAGIGDGLVRLSAGVEDVADVIADLEQALRA